MSAKKKIDSEVRHLGLCLACSIGDPPPPPLDGERADPDIFPQIDSDILSLVKEGFHDKRLTTGLMPKVASPTWTDDGYYT